MVNKTGQLAAGGPLIAHCSAGLGRTGVFVVVHTALECHRAGKKVDIESIVTRLRQQREGIIQTPEQYQFCLEAVAEAVSPGMRPRAQTGLAQRPKAKDTRPFSEPPHDQDTPQTKRRKLYLQHSIPPPPAYPPPHAESEPTLTTTGSMKQKTPSFVTPTKSLASPPPPTSSPPPPLTPPGQETTPIYEYSDESDTELIQRKLAAMKDESPERELTAATRKPQKSAEKRMSRTSVRTKKPAQKEKAESRRESGEKEDKAKKPNTAAEKLESRRPAAASKKQKSNRDGRRLSKEEMKVKFKGYERPEFPEEEEASQRDALEEEDEEEPGFELPGFEIGNEQLLESKSPKKKEEKKPRKPGLPPAWSRLPPSPKKAVTAPVVNRVPDEVKPPKRVGRLVIPSAFGGPKSEEHKVPQDQEKVTQSPPKSQAVHKPEERPPPKLEQAVEKPSAADKPPAPKWLPTTERKTNTAGYSKWQAASHVGQAVILRKKQQSEAPAAEKETKPVESGDTPPVLRMIRQLEVKDRGGSSPSPRPSPRPSPTHKPLEQAKPVEQTKRLQHSIYQPTPIVSAVTSVEKEQPSPPSETSGGNITKLLARFQGGQ